MSGNALVRVLLSTFLLLAVARSRSVAQEAAAPDKRPPLNARALPPGHSSASYTQEGPAPADTLLQLDTNYSGSYCTSFKAGDQVGVVLQASSLQYPLVVRSIVSNIYCFAPSMTTVRLRGHVYAMDGGTPGTLLGSSEVIDEDLGQIGVERWVSFDLSAASVQISDPRPVLVAVEYVSGTEGQTPSIVSDVSIAIPRGLCYYQEESGLWREHYDHWRDASRIGYSMIRAWVETSGGPSDETSVEPIADAILLSGFPTLAQGSQGYLQVGDHGPVWGDVRSMIRFPSPSAPVAGATPIAASVRLYHHQAVSQTVPLTITVHRVTQEWDEASATWSRHSDHYTDTYGSVVIPGRDASEAWVDRMLHVDVTRLLTECLQGAFPDHGLMLIGGEDTPDTCKWFRSREWRIEDQHPRLVIRWALPEPTPTSTPATRKLFLPLIQKG